MSLGRQLERWRERARFTMDSADSDHAAVATIHNCTLYQSELGHMAAEVWFTHAGIDVPRMHEV